MSPVSSLGVAAGIASKIPVAGQVLAPLLEFGALVTGKKSNTVNRSLSYFFHAGAPKELGRVLYQLWEERGDDWLSAVWDAFVRASGIRTKPPEAPGYRYGPPAQLLAGGTAAFTGDWLPYARGMFRNPCQRPNEPYWIREGSRLAKLKEETGCPPVGSVSFPWIKKGV